MAGVAALIFCKRPQRAGLLRIFAIILIVLTVISLLACYTDLDFGLEGFFGRVQHFHFFLMLIINILTISAVALYLCGSIQNLNSAKASAPPRPAFPSQPTIVQNAPGQSRPQNFAAPSPAGQEIQPSPVATPQQSRGSGDLLATVAYKSNGESCRFFRDHLEFEGNIVSYADIAEMDCNNSTRSAFAVLFWYSRYIGYVRFTLLNGQKLKVAVNGISFYSIGGVRSAKKRFPALFDAAFDIVAAAMAQNALAQIRQGATVNLAGLEINREFAVYKKLLNKEPIYISRDNYGHCGLDGYNVLIFDKAGKRLFYTSDDNVNALLLPYVLKALWGN
jgi:hypothetical protein